jgi:hypothetical protein
MRRIGWGVLLALCCAALFGLALQVNAVRSEVRRAEAGSSRSSARRCTSRSSTRPAPTSSSSLPGTRLTSVTRAPNGGQYLENVRELAALGKPAGRGAPSRSGWPRLRRDRARACPRRWSRRSPASARGRGARGRDSITTRPLPGSGERSPSRATEPKTARDRQTLEGGQDSEAGQSAKADQAGSRRRRRRGDERDDLFDRARSGRVQLANVRQRSLLVAQVRR